MDSQEYCLLFSPTCFWYLVDFYLVIPSQHNKLPRARRNSRIAEFVEMVDMAILHIQNSIILIQTTEYRIVGYFRGV